MALARRRSASQQMPSTTAQHPFAKMLGMEIFIGIAVVGLAAALVVIGWLLAERRATSALQPVTWPVEPVAAPEVPQQLIAQAVSMAVAQANERASRERDLAVQAAVEQAITMAGQQLGAASQANDATLAARQQLIDQRLGEVQSGVQTDIQRLSALVQQLGQATTERFGQVDRS